MRDPESGLEVLLQYGVLEELDIITRAVKVVNRTMGKVVLLKAASMCLDWLSGDYEWLTFMESMRWSAPCSALRLRMAFLRSAV